MRIKRGPGLALTEDLTESDYYSSMISPGCLRVRSPETQRTTQRAPVGQVRTPQGSGSKGKKSCSQAFVEPTKAEGISPVQISPPGSMGVRAFVCVCPLPLPKRVHTLPMDLRLPKDPSSPPTPLPPGPSDGATSTWGSDRPSQAVG